MISLANHIIEIIFLIYAIAIIGHYYVLAVLALYELRKSVVESQMANYKALMITSFAPSVSVIAPAFNEEKTIVENINGLLHLHYPKYEIIVVNDGSKDSTLERAIEAFDLVKVDYAIDNKIKHREIRGIYRSNKAAFTKLKLIDKENGGKSDALNAGINIAEGEYFMTIDVDTIIDPYVVQYLIKPFFESSGERVIAVGGSVRVANSCRFRRGHLMAVNIPQNLLARFQVLEYIRAFLLSRLAWSRLNGMLLISGALGMFNREIVVECGGYSTKTVGEDMDLVIRMRRYMYDRNERHRVVLVPHPMCWTEVPGDSKIFGRQRTRWTRGLIDCLLNHKVVFFNPKYGIMGMVSFPTTALFEWFAPVIQILGIFYFLYLIVIKSVFWPYFLILLFFVYLFGIAFSTWALLYDHFAYHKYKDTGQLIKLLIISWIEAFTFNPMNSFFSLKGNYEYFIKRKRNGWGDMSREGFATMKRPVL